ncbi:MAG: hypothetical protein AAGB51_10360 [Planctomycetota bacterium]
MVSGCWVVGLCGLVALVAGPRLSAAGPVSSLTLDADASNAASGSSVLSAVGRRSPFLFDERDAYDGVGDTSGLIDGGVPFGFNDNLTFVLSDAGAFVNSALLGSSHGFGYSSGDTVSRFRGAFNGVAQTRYEPAFTDLDSLRSRHTQRWDVETKGPFRIEVEGDARAFGTGIGLGVQTKIDIGFMISWVEAGLTRSYRETISVNTESDTRFDERLILEFEAEALAGAESLTVEAFADVELSDLTGFDGARAEAIVNTWSIDFDVRLVAIPAPASGLAFVMFGICARRRR